jgi:ribose-phosphate pyrophosphokinase
VIVDDMIDTAGTVSEASRALIRLGAREVYVCATHALLSGPAAQRLSEAPIVEVTVTDTINIPPERRFPTLQVLSVGELLAKGDPLHAQRPVGELAVRVAGGAAAGWRRRAGRVRLVGCG